MEKSDGWKWNASPNGMFSIKSAYTTLSMTATANHSYSEKPEFTMIWKTPATQKAKTTAWRVLKGRMAICDNLQRQQVNISSSEAVCVLCKTHLETTEHLFFTCQNSVDIWNDVLNWLGKKTVLHHKAKDHFLAFRSIGDKEEEKFYSGIWICIIWCVWKGRNEGKFNQGVWNKDRIVTEIKSRLWGWKEAFNLTNASPDFRS
ncbi:uncharacterized protein LOC130994480 [Salvia miltiorrhiza]|uniref:uncharacterized protein LOC130994480 n=1 Tax=Salvia miltiorrhiza TaxID=226208 RepID=UPI0025AD09EC|nr:uncharacterized protein LOC130994480 [Salvia miltiorrhiza]